MRPDTHVVKVVTDSRAAPSTGVTRLPRYYQPLRHPLACQPIPGAAGYTAYFAPPISQRGEEGFSSCLARPRHRAVAITPPECRSASASLRYAMLPSSTGNGLGLQTFQLSGLPVRSLALRPGDSSTTPYGGRVNGLQIIGFSPPCHPNYGALALTPAGLSPAERASLCWTHCRTSGFPTVRSLAGHACSQCARRPLEVVSVSAIVIPTRFRVSESAGYHHLRIAPPATPANQRRADGACYPVAVDGPVDGVTFMITQAAGRWQWSRDTCAARTSRTFSEKHWFVPNSGDDAS